MTSITFNNLLKYFNIELQIPEIKEDLNLNLKLGQILV